MQIIWPEGEAHSSRRSGDETGQFLQFLNENMHFLFFIRKISSEHEAHFYSEFKNKNKLRTILVSTEEQSLKILI